MARIFLSYQSLDRESALALEGTATAAGHRVFLDCLPEGGINVGDDWERRLYDGLYESHALVALISAAYIESQWCFAELAIARARGLLILLVVLSSGLRHPLLGDVQHLDVGGDPAATGERLLARLRDLEAPGAAGWSPDRPLYAGLEPFDVADAAVFFGRSQETANLLELVVSSTTHARRQPVFVTGASGCGKSSMVRAGLIPALHRRGGWLSVPPVIAGESPIDALALAVVRGFKGRGAADFDAVTQTLREDPSRLWRGLAAAGAENAHGLLIVVDQFEELFRPSIAGPAQEFIAILDKALSLRDPQVSVVATLRSDAVGRLPALWAQRAELVPTYVLAPLGTAQLAEVIRGPALVAGIRVSDELVSTLVQDTGDGRALPFLSFVLREMAKGVGRGGELTLQLYRALGGVKKALGQEADRALAEAATETGATPEHVLQSLTELVGLDDAGTPLRRRRRMSAGDSFQRVIAPFVDRRFHPPFCFNELSASIGTS